MSTPAPPPSQRDRRGNGRVAYINARLVDPTTGYDGPGGLLTDGRLIADWGPRLFNAGTPSDVEIVDCAGRVLAPGLIDMRVFTGEPGAEHKETLASASQAAAAGGVTTMIVMPNTDPVIDDVALVDFIERRARDTALVNVHPMAALTKGLAGQVMTEIGLLSEAGALAFTDGDRSITNARLLRRALSYASTFDALIVQHAEDPELAAGGAVNEGPVSTRLGLGGIPTIAETVIVERDMRIVAITGARYHLSQCSCADTLEVIRAAKARGLPVTAGVAAHHLALNELDVANYRTFFKTSPPLRAEADRLAMVDGVCDGTIDVIVSSHDPQAAENKRLPFGEAAFGAIGLETLLSVALKLHHEHDAPLLDVLRPLTVRPAEILRLPGGRLAKGAPADLVLIDPDLPFVLEPERLRSRTRNTPFDGRKLQGLALRTIVGGATVFTREAAHA
jgi:dihydroorotase